MLNRGIEVVYQYRMKCKPFVFPAVRSPCGGALPMWPKLIPQQSNCMAKDAAASGSKNCDKVVTIFVFFIYICICIYARARTL